MKINIFNDLYKLTNGMTNTIRNNKSDILVGVGISGGIVSTVMACIASFKLEGIFKKNKAVLDDIQEKNPEAKKEVTKMYVKTAVEVVGLYLPAIGVGLLGYGCIIHSHNLLNKENASLVVAYSALDTSYRKYRSRVSDKYGAEAEEEIRLNTTDHILEETTVDENGKKKKTKKTIKITNVDEASEYARYYVKCNFLTPEMGAAAWEADMDYNESFIRSQEFIANDILLSSTDLNGRSAMFLNTAYAMFGIKPSKAGQVVGWIRDKDNPVGDNRIKFIQKIVWRKNPETEEPERVILLDFNVDGPILERAEELGIIK